MQTRLRPLPLFLVQTECFRRAGIRRVLTIIAMSVGTLLVQVTSVNADIVLFNGLDAGSGPGGSQTNSNAAESAFTIASTAIGTVQIIDFESLPTVELTDSTTVLAPGVSVRHFAFGNSSGDRARILDAHINPNTGFNTTAGGNNFVYWTTSPATPSTGQAALRFTFDEGIQGFGAKFTNWGTNSGATSTLTYRFNNGAAQIVDIPRSGDAGGIQFAGFLDAGESITSMDIFFLASPVNRGGELFGVDDISIARLQSVPEPSALLLACLAGALATLRRRRQN